MELLGIEATANLALVAMAGTMGHEDIIESACSKVALVGSAGSKAGLLRSASKVVAQEWSLQELGSRSGIKVTEVR